MTTTTTEKRRAGRTPKDAPSQIAQRALEDEAVTLRAQRLGYREIARRLDVDVAVAYRRVQAALDRTVREPAATVRLLEIEGLDAQEADLLSRLEHPYQGHEDEDGERELVYTKTPQEAAALHTTILKVRERRARLLGLDMPVQVDVAVEVRVVAPLALIESRLDRLAAGLPVIDGEVVAESGG